MNNYILKSQYHNIQLNDELCPTFQVKTLSPHIKAWSIIFRLKLYLVETGKDQFQE